MRMRPVLLLLVMERRVRRTRTRARMRGRPCTRAGRGCLTCSVRGPLLVLRCILHLLRLSGYPLVHVCLSLRRCHILLSRRIVLLLLLLLVRRRRRVVEVLLRVRRLARAVGIPHVLRVGVGMGMGMVVRHDALVLELRRRIYAIDFMAREDNRPCTFQNNKPATASRQSVLRMRLVTYLNTRITSSSAYHEEYTRSRSAVVSHRSPPPPLPSPRFASS